MVTYNNSTDLYGVTSYIVDATAGQGNYTTIAAALTAATAASFAGDIFIRPGTYTENPALVAGVNLVAWPGDGISGTVIIKGNCTFSSAGTVTISGCQLLTNSAAILTVSGSAASIVNVSGCYLNMGTTAIVYSSSGAGSQINLYNCYGNVSTTSVTPFNMSSAGTLTAIGCNFTNTGGSVTATTMSAGATVFQNCTFQSVITNSSTNAITSSYSTYIGTGTNTIPFNVSSTGTNTSLFDSFTSFGNNSAIQIITSSNLTLTGAQISSAATYAVFGSGAISYQGCMFTGTSKIVNVTTQTVSGTLYGGELVVPTAGMIGEVIKSTYSAVAIGTGVTAMASIALTRGNWILSGGIEIPGGAFSSLTGVISATTGSLTPILTGGAIQSAASASIATNMTFPSLPLLTTGATYFLNAGVGASSTTAQGIFMAVRIG